MNDEVSIDVFVTESRELLRDMEAALLVCERGDCDAEAINAIFRAAHTIKGSAGLFGLDAIVAFTHVLEGVLDRVRAQELTLHPQLIGVLLECCDHMSRMVQAVADPAGAPLGNAGAELLEELTRLTGQVPSAAESPCTEAASQRAAAAAPYGALEVGTECWHISVRFDVGVLKNGMDPLAIIRYLGTFGGIASVQIVDDALPAAAEFDPECCYLGFEIAFQTDADKTRIEAAFEFVRDDCTLRILPPRSRVSDYVALIEQLPEANARLGELLIACGTLTAHELQACLQWQAELASTEGTQRPLGELLVARQVVQAPVVEAALEKQRASKQKSAEARMLRVDGAKLDRLIDLIGELVIAGATTTATARQAGLSILGESTQRLGRLVEEVRDQALKLRMVQIGGTFARFHRIVRDESARSGKHIELEVSGSETELDKTLVESIVDPLTHLVRNAIDHGVEQPQVRRAAGKNPRGCVRLNAYHDAGSIVIEVADDGGGLDAERILAKARERALITHDQQLSDEQVHALIFEPGFSTAAQVTNLSGRGVGMDVVKRNVTALRGTVSVQTSVGLGTLVRIRLPLTLAIINAFLVRVGRSAFAIPLDMVEECIELDAQQRAAAHDHHYVALRGAVLPFIRLRQLFTLQGSVGRRESIVVVRCGEQRVGIVVEELLGEQQAVIKPLSRLFSRIRGISGSTILGTGELALILDIPGLIEQRLAAQALSHPAVRKAFDS